MPGPMGTVLQAGYNSGWGGWGVFDVYEKDEKKLSPEYR